MMSCPSQRTEISACACSAWRFLTRLGKLTCLKPFTWEKVGSPEWPYPQGHPTPQARFTVSHVNGRQWFISNCRKTWLAPVGWGARGRAEGGFVGSTFLHINRASETSIYALLCSPASSPRARSWARKPLGSRVRGIKQNWRWGRWWLLRTARNIGKTVRQITQDKKRTWISEIKLTFAPNSTLSSKSGRHFKNVHLFVQEKTLVSTAFQQR